MNEDNQTVSQPRTLRTELAPISARLGRGLEIETFDDAYRWAEAVHQSQACPPGFSKVDCLVVIINGLEVGMSPMAAIQSSYIVNNRVTIFGDMPLALVRASPVYESYSQKYVGKPFDDDFACVITSKRKGEEPLTTEYSVADAKLAELWNKRSKDGTKPTPWVTAPKRMLLFRARGFNLRDNFGDVLKGCAIAELDDHYGEEGYGAAKQAEARIIEPRFGALKAPAQASPVEPAQAPPAEAPKRKKKEEPPPVHDIMADAASNSAAPTAPPSSEPTSSGAPELLKRLEAERLSHKGFLLRMHHFKCVGNATPEDIKTGRYTIENLEADDVDLALKNWKQVTEGLESLV